MTYPGQSRERTAIAWGRTALGAAALGVLLLKLGVEQRSGAELAGAVLELAAAGGYAWRGRAGFRHPGGGVPVGMFRWLTAAQVLVGVLAVVGAFGPAR